MSLHTIKALIINRPLEMSVSIKTLPSIIDYFEKEKMYYFKFSEKTRGDLVDLINTNILLNSSCDVLTYDTNILSFNEYLTRLHNTKDGLNYISSKITSSNPKVNTKPYYELFVQ